MKSLTIALVGPSGAGKGTLLKHFVSTRDGVATAVSVTTRARREGEVDGVDYYFVDDQTFNHMDEREELIEFSRHFGASYGTLKSEFQKEGVIMVDVDINGATTFKNCLQNLVLVFVTVSDVTVLSERIRKRGGNSPERVEERVRQAAERLDEEIAFCKECDEVIYNDDLNEALRQMEAILNKHLK